MAAQGLLDTSASWFCAECLEAQNSHICGNFDGVGEQPFVESGGQGPIPSSGGGKRQRPARRNCFRDEAGAIVLVARDNERPRDIARLLQLDTGGLLKLNSHIVGLRSDSRLHCGTQIRIPASALRDTSSKLRMAEGGDVHVSSKGLSPAAEDGDGPFERNVFTAERIINRRSKPKGEVEYLVQWEGFPEEDATWEPRRNILSDQLIADFESRRRIGEDRDSYELVLEKHSHGPHSGRFGFKVRHEPLRT